MTVAEILQNLAKKAGINTDSPEFKALVSAQGLNIDIPEAIATGYETGLMNEDSAKNNNKLAYHFKALNYNAIDTELAKLYDELGIDEPSKTELLNDKSTVARVVKSMHKIKELECKKAAANDTTDKKEIQKQIDDLTQKLKDGEESWKREKEGILKQHDTELTDREIEGLLGQFNYVFPKEMPKAAQIAAAKSIFNSQLDAKGAKVIRENGKLKLVQNNDSNLEYQDEKHNKIDLSGFANKTFSEQNLLVTIDPKKPGNNDPKITSHSDGFKANSDALSDASSELAAMRAMAGK